MHIEEIMGYAAIFFGVLGSWGLYKQAQMIWVSKSVESVSGTWVDTYLAMFVAFFIYGLQQDSIPMTFQGSIRVLFSLPIFVGFMYFGKKNKFDLMLIILYCILLSCMSFKIVSSLIFTTFSFLGIFASFVQAYTIWKNASRGKVSIELQLIYLSAVICWVVYAFVRNDVPFLVVSAGFIFSYSATIIMWFKYPNKIKKTVSTL